MEIFLGTKTKLTPSLFELTNGILELHDFFGSQKIHSDYIYIFFFFFWWIDGWVNWRDLYNLNL